MPYLSNLQYNVVPELALPLHLGVPTDEQTEEGGDNRHGLLVLRQGIQGEDNMYVCLYVLYVCIFMYGHKQM